MTREIRLSDWTPYPFELIETGLDVTLDPDATVVRASLRFAPRETGAALVLDGGKGLELDALVIDGVPLSGDSFTRNDERLTIHKDALPASAFTLESVVRIAPKENTTLEGLYVSNGMFCTQCEAEGFRHITFYPDRPDVMAPFRVVVRADLPVLLSNGNPVASGDGWAEWHDPWPKPAYLFALVAGDLRAVSGQFTTMLGRDVALNVWVRPGDEDRAGFALESLIKSMRWDEQVYGRDYDLDVFNIVAVDDFNMGAMENKGLNIFNSKLVLASPETATDLDYERIEAVIAHEYFHNWTGNRITCRDWFQLCLKEGLTVYRDQSFTGDMRSAAVKRIEDVVTLRGRQFREDAGPLSHPPRPDHYQEINNFYTATVYEKGAEVVGMLKTLVGPEQYRAALDLYFDRHDGDAATIEDWLKVFEDATGRDLTQFKRWYTDAGTPSLTMHEDWDEASGRLTLRFHQTTAPTPGQTDKAPRVIPIAVGLIGPNGDEVAPTRILEMTQAEQDFAFDGLGARPVVSALRGFSAPVVLHRPMIADQQAHLLAHDIDPFAKWEAGHSLAMDALVAATQPDNDRVARDVLIPALGGLLLGAPADPAFAALALRLPDEDAIAAEIVTRGGTPDPDLIHTARQALARDIAAAHHDTLARLYDEMAVSGDYRPDAEPAGKRALRLAALSLLTHLDGGDRAAALWASAGNMTEKMGALGQLVRTDRANAALAEMEQMFADNRLVMDKFFAVQPAFAPPARALELAEALAARPDFDWKNPNRFRALIAGFGGNQAAFHAADGAGYRFVAKWLGRMDAVNPQTAARMSSLFETWPRFDAARRDQAQAALSALTAQPGLSRNSTEMVTRILAAG